MEKLGYEVTAISVMLTFESKASIFRRHFPSCLTTAFSLMAVTETLVTILKHLLPRTWN